MTIFCLSWGPQWTDAFAMDADAVTLARLLSIAALVAATIEYAEIIRRRGLRRAEARERATREEIGLHGLVRVLLADAGQRRTESSTP